MKLPSLTIRNRTFRKIVTVRQYFQCTCVFPFLKMRKIGPSKICGRQALKKLMGYGLLHHTEIITLICRVTQWTGFYTIKKAIFLQTF